MNTRTKKYICSAASTYAGENKHSLQILQAGIQLQVSLPDTSQIAALQLIPDGFASGEGEAEIVVKGRGVIRERYVIVDKDIRIGVYNLLETEQEIQESIRKLYE